MVDMLEKALHEFKFDNPLSVAALLKLIRKTTANAKPIKDLINITPEVVENLYGIAVYLYNQHRYQLALDVFDQLKQLDITSGVYPLGAGACQQALGSYSGAVSNYSLAAANDPKNPTPLFYAAELSLVINKKEAAYYFYEQVVKLAGKNKDFAKMKDRAEAILKARHK